MDNQIVLQTSLFSTAKYSLSYSNTQMPTDLILLISLANILTRSVSDATGNLVCQCITNINPPSCLEDPRSSNKHIKHESTCPTTTSGPVTMPTSPNTYKCCPEKHSSCNPECSNLLKTPLCIFKSFIKPATLAGNCHKSVLEIEEPEPPFMADPVIIFAIVGVLAFLIIILGLAMWFTTPKEVLGTAAASPPQPPPETTKEIAAEQPQSVKPTITEHTQKSDSE